MDDTDATQPPPRPSAAPTTEPVVETRLGRKAQAHNPVTFVDGKQTTPHRESDELVHNSDGTINWADTLAPERISYRHEFVIHLGALGMTVQEIADRSGYSYNRTSQLLGSTIGRQMIREQRAKLMQENIEQRLRLMAPKALAVVDEIIANPAVKPQVRLRGALDVIAHAAGRPQQRIEHTSGNLRQLFELLDRQQQAGYTDETVVSAQAADRAVEVSADVQNATPPAPAQASHTNASLEPRPEGPVDGSAASVVAAGRTPS